MKRGQKGAIKSRFDSRAQRGQTTGKLPGNGKAQAWQRPTYKAAPGRVSAAKVCKQQGFNGRKAKG